MKLKKKTVKSRNRKSKKTLYFGKEAHQAIVDYQNAETRPEKHALYIKNIKPSFDKLAENLIYIHGFAKDQDHFKILKSDCVTFLYETLEKFDPKRGSKAFSYFNVCAKNFLIIRSKKNSKNRERNVSIENFKNLSAAEKKAIENYKVIPSQEDVIIRSEDKKILIEMLHRIKNKVNNQNEKLCIDAIITLFNKIDDLDFLNKRAIFVYLREISGLNAKQLSVAMSNIRKYYRELLKFDSMYILFREAF